MPHHLPDELFDRVRARLATGEAVDFESLASEHPDHADEIRNLGRIFAVMRTPPPAAWSGSTKRMATTDIPAAPTPAPGNGPGNGMPTGLVPGLRLGKFELDREIGKGGMGVVWRARDTLVEKMFALKFPHPWLANDENVMRDLKRETHNLLNLTHQHIVRCLGMDQQGGFTFIILEYLRGPSLLEVLQDRQRGRSHGLDSHEVLWVLEQAAAAIDFAHQHACWHLDLKPGNLLLSDLPGDQLINRSVQVKVTDFGLSYRAKRSSELSGSLPQEYRRGGTWGYLPPEIVRRENPTHAADIYSLGATLYHLLSGSPPFVGEDLAERIQKEPPSPLPGDSAGLGAVVMRCLAKKPEDRPQTARAVLQGALHLPPRVLTPESPRRSLFGLLGLSRSAPGKIPDDCEAVDQQAGAHDWARTIRDKRTGITFQLIEPGSFHCGSPDGQGHENEHPRHRVEVRQPFYLADAPVTVAQWKCFHERTCYRTAAVREGRGLTLNADGVWEMHRVAKWSNPFPQFDTEAWDEQHPVTMVTWDDAQQFCELYRYRLPSEAEWEYACRARTPSVFWWGNATKDAKGRGNFADQCFRTSFPRARATYERLQLGGFNFDDGWVFTSPVTWFQPNPWGLYDMLGNVWEWCQDCYDPTVYQQKVLHEPLGMNGRQRVLRGGSFANAPDACRCAFRYRASPDHASARIGFRPVIHLG